jgi:hypothetical protein
VGLLGDVDMDDVGELLSEAMCMELSYEAGLEDVAVVLVLNVRSVARGEDKEDAWFVGVSPRLSTAPGAELLRLRSGNRKLGSKKTGSWAKAPYDLPA